MLLFLLDCFKNLLEMKILVKAWLIFYKNEVVGI
jgi:hypothetical protein